MPQAMPGFKVTDRRGELDDEPDVERENPHCLPEEMRLVAKTLGVDAQEIVALNDRMVSEEDKQISPPGALNLPPLLEEKRLRWRMPDACFKGRAPLFDHVYLWQIPEEELDTGMPAWLVLPDEAKQRLKNQMPCGVIVNAGLGALDVMRSHCIEIGHTVTFMRFTPWRLPVTHILGSPVYVLPLKVSSLRDSKELGEAMDRGEVTIEWDEENRVHYYLDWRKKPQRSGPFRWLLSLWDRLFWKPVKREPLQLEDGGTD